MIIATCVDGRSKCYTCKTAVYTAVHVKNWWCYTFECKIVCKHLCESIFCNFDKLRPFIEIRKDLRNFSLERKRFIFASKIRLGLSKKEGHQLRD